MVLESVQTGRFEFGPYSLDPSSGELRKHGTRIKLQERPFRVLLMLLEVPGQVVSREELQMRLWPDGTFVDFDHGISSGKQTSHRPQRLRRASSFHRNRRTPRLPDDLSRHPR